MNKALIFTIIIILLNNCTKSESNNIKSQNSVNIIGSAELLWRTEVITSVGYGYTTFTNDEVIFFSAENDSKSLKFLDKKTGKITSIWNDWINPTQKLMNVGFMPVFYPKYICLTDVYGAYVIDANTKKTLFSKEYRWDVRNVVKVFDGLFFYKMMPEEAKNNRPYNGTMYMYDLNTHENRQLFNLNYGNIDSSLVHIEDFFDVQKINGDIKLYFATWDNSYHSKQLYNSNSGVEFLRVFNISKNIMEDSCLLNQFGAGQIVKYKNNLITSDLVRGLHSIDINTKKLKWSNEQWVRQDGVISISSRGFTLDESREIIYICVGFTLKAIDAETGNILWTSQNLSNETCKPFVMNGVVYVTTSKLWALDAKTGEVLWQIRTSDDDGTDFQNHNVTGDGERIYVSSDRYAYCFKAAK